MRFVPTFLCWSLPLILAACGGDSSPEVDVADGPLEVRGQWSDNWGTDWEITEDRWGAWTVMSFDNASNVGVVQYPADDEYSPNTFSKLAWTDISQTEGTWAYCTVNFGKETAEAAAEDGTAPDANDLEGVGCGGFPWTLMSPKAAD